MVKKRRKPVRKPPFSRRKPGSSPRYTPQTNCQPPRDEPPGVPMVGLMLIDEVAPIFRRRPATIRRWIATGNLPAIRVGRSIFVRRSDVLTFLAADLDRAIGDVAGASQHSNNEDRSATPMALNHNTKSRRS